MLVFFEDADSVSVSLMINVLGICYGTPQNGVDADSVSTKLVEINQICMFKVLSVES